MAVPQRKPGGNWKPSFFCGIYLPFRLPRGLDFTWARNAARREWNSLVAEKHILILTADAGLGHRRSAEAIEAALFELYDDRCQVQVINPLDRASAPKLIRQLEKDYDEYVLEDPQLYQLAYQALETPVVSKIAQQLAGYLLQDVLLDIVRQTTFDALLTTYLTHAHPAANAFKKVGRRVPLAVVVTDLTGVQRLWFSPAASMHFVPTPEVRQQALENEIDPSRVKLTGLPVQPAFALEKRGSAELRDELGWQQDVPTALVVASQRTQRMANISQILDQADMGLQLALVCGGAGRLFDHLSAVDWQGEVHLYGWVEDMSQLMRASDFIISKAGGMIVSEALASGLPIILSEALPGQEVGNARYVVKEGAGAWAPGPAEVVATVHAWLEDDRSELARVQSNAARIGKPRAAFDIAETLWGLAEAG